MGFPASRAAAVATGIGLVSMLASPRRLCGAIAFLVVAIASGAAVLRVLPLCSRIALYLVPVVALLLAAALARVLDLSSSSSRAWKTATTVALLAVLAASAYHHPWGRIVDPPSRENLRPVLERVARQWRAGDHLLVHFRAWPAFRFYSKVLGLPFSSARRVGDWRPISSGQRAGASRGWTVPLAEALPTEGRTWVVAVGDRAFRDQDRVLPTLRRRGRSLASIQETEAIAWLFDLRPADSALDRRPVGEVADRP